MAIIEVKHLHKVFGDLEVLKDISFEVQEGEVICLIGPSGSGKSTLLRCLNKLEEKQDGEIVILGENTSNIKKINQFRENIGMVFQHFNLFPNYTVLENMTLAPVMLKKMNKKEAIERAGELLKRVGLYEKKDVYPVTLSGGQKQRVAIARALALSPKFLLLDEPLSALDAKVRQKVRVELKNLQNKLGITTIMVTHDQEEALTMADKIVVMNNACIKQIGTPNEVYDHPDSPFVADFIGSINMFTTNYNEDNDDPNRFKIKAIRPENIEVLPNTAPEGVKVKVINIEFHGATYRLTLRLREDSAVTLMDNDITVDVPTSVFTEYDIKQGGHIKVKFNDSRMIYYNTDKEQPVLV